ncbi:MAG: hypothetical protein WAT19_02040 [Ferruginibacter sp.]
MEDHSQVQDRKKQIFRKDGWAKSMDQLKEHLLKDRLLVNALKIN